MLKFHEIIDSWGITSPLDMRLISILYEHKKIQTYKFNRLFQEKHIKDYSVCIYSQNIEKMAYNAVLVALKMELSKSYSCLKEIMHDIIDEIIDGEQLLHQKILMDAENGNCQSSK